jgi:hypothetical protein
MPVALALPVMRGLVAVRVTRVLPVLVQLLAARVIRVALERTAITVLARSMVMAVLPVTQETHPRLVT